MRSPYFLIAVLTLFFVNACSNKDSNPVKSDKEGKIVLKDINPTTFEHGNEVTVHGEKFGTDIKNAHVLFGSVAAPIDKFKGENYLTAIVPNRAQDGFLSVVYGKDTSNALPYKIKWKIEDYKSILNNINKVIIFRKVQNLKEDTLVYDLILNEKYTNTNQNIDLSIDTNNNRIVLHGYITGNVYKWYAGSPCDSSELMEHLENWDFNDIPIISADENEFIAYSHGLLGKSIIWEHGSAPEWHHAGWFCESQNNVYFSDLQGSIRLIFLFE
ncbi:MAG: IPT/TIG domain-containing protein [Chloroflexota bacterium]